MAEDVANTEAVLIIDDDRVDRLTVREYIKNQYTLFEAKNGEEARTVLESHPIACVLLDYNIPGTDSLELLSSCVKKQLPVVMLTGEGNEDLAVSAMKRGAVDYLKKRNLNEDLLVRTLHRSIQTVALKQQLAHKQQELLDANAELRDKVEELERLNGDLENFIHIAAHDFREPLKILYNYSDLLQRTLGTAVTDDAQAFLNTMRNSVKRLAALIDDLRALTKIGYGSIEKSECSLGEIIDEVLEDFDKMLLAKAEFKRDDLPEVLVYKPLVKELYRNLIDNALKYGNQEQLKVYFSSERRGEEAVFGVHNNGSTISPGDFERIFQPFFRLSYDHDHEGSGMGLSLCKKIVERHGGRIWVESPQPNEIKFLFTLGKGAV